MAGIAPVSRHELSQRRQQLRRQRRNRILTMSWRSLVVLGIAGTLVWAVTQPNWVIRNAAQVKIEGNQFLAANTIRSLLPINYPESLSKVQPAKIAETLKDKAPIAEVSVERHLFPPGLTVRIRERKPVAQAWLTLPPQGKSSPASRRNGDETTNPAPTNSASASNEGSPSSPSNSSEASSKRAGSSKPSGLLDENGRWIPLESYAAVEQNLQLPPLKVIGNPDTYRPHWDRFYPMISRSPVTVQAIDWQNPGNLILTTEIGVVHLGAYGNQFANQIRVLDRVRELPRNKTASSMEYLDLRNPNTPILKLRGTTNSGKISTP
ncbi:cell division protein FtsQ/DivIB [Alkalinema pantanalense CENA528]|uniref:cell division protein FtsQ/DivIB n=1 Tax=Alkalinema pantanalense TaxID=1620705 RepID=UPI003D6FA5E2